MQLIPEWRKAWRMVSVQCMALALALQGTWSAMPVELQQAVPAPIVQLITLALLGFGIVGRLVLQPKLAPQHHACPHCGQPHIPAEGDHPGA